MRIISNLFSPPFKIFTEIVEKYHSPISPVVEKNVVLLQMSTSKFSKFQSYQVAALVKGIPKYSALLNSLDSAAFKIQTSLTKESAIDDYSTYLVL